MLPACASSPTDGPPASAPDPVIVMRSETRMVCPAELLLDLPARPAPPHDAQIRGNDTAMAWLRAILSRLALVEDRLTDARAECP